jgi:glycosyltransferase involved in cell wall biosynthesis
MSYAPNLAAATYLIESIWPSILSALPNARLTVAGAYPERIPSFAGNPPGVEFSGFVGDLASLYKDVAVVCCPILAGGGTRIKILEAAAYGKPIVSTTVGSEGIELKNGTEILLRDDPGSFAEACIRLLKDRVMAARIGKAARSVARRLYDEKEVVKEIRSHFDSGRHETPAIKAAVQSPR